MSRIAFCSAFSLMALSFTPSAYADESLRTAHKLINSQGCKACHSISGDGGNHAASFEDIRGKRTWGEIRLKLANASGRHGDTRIADFSHLSDEEIDALVDFIETEPTKEKTP